VAAQAQRFGSVKEAPQSSGNKNLPPIWKIAKIENQTFETRRNGGRGDKESLVADLRGWDAEAICAAPWFPVNLFTYTHKDS
jgi:hypothetical protein